MLDVGRQINRLRSRRRGSCQQRVAELPFFCKFRRGRGKLDAELDPLGRKRDLARDSAR